MLLRAEVGGCVKKLVGLGGEQVTRGYGKSPRGQSEETPRRTREGSPLKGQQRAVSLKNKPRSDIRRWEGKRRTWRRLGGGAMRRWQLEVAAGWVEESGTETEMQMTFWKVVK